MSKTAIMHIEKTNTKKTNTNIACNYFQVKYNNFECKTTNLLQVMTFIAWK